MGGGGGEVPNASSQPNFGPNPSYQIRNPIPSDCLQTDVHNELKALIDSVWIHLPSPGQKEIFHCAGEHSLSSNPCWHKHNPQFCIIIFCNSLKFNISLQFSAWITVLFAEK